MPAALHQSVTVEIGKGGGPINYKLIMVITVISGRGAGLTKHLGIPWAAQVFFPPLSD